MRPELEGLVALYICKKNNQMERWTCTLSIIIDHRVKNICFVRFRFSGVVQSYKFTWELFITKIRLADTPEY